MKINEIVEKLGLTIYCGENGLDNEVVGGYTSDLLSDVMGNCESKMVWITLQTHKNTMAIAGLKDISAIILVSGHKPDNDTIEKSIEENIPILGTDLSCFDISGKLYSLIN